ncbi:MAG TPA: ion channel [Ignavibacteriaceae bacterium]|nr:ion channel [Ignavibacteriaceae bacterium]
MFLFKKNNNHKKEDPIKSTIFYLPDEIEKLRERWRTTEGKVRRKYILTKLAAGIVPSEGLPPFPDNLRFPVNGISIPDNVDWRGLILGGEYKSVSISNIHLSGALLQVIFNQCNFFNSHFEYVEFSGSHIEHCNFKGAFFYETNFENISCFQNIDIREAYFNDIRIEPHKVFSESGFITNFEAEIGRFYAPYVIYHHIKTKYKSISKYEEMIPFHILEMRSRRNFNYTTVKNNRKKIKIKWYLDLIFFDMMCGYGEKWQHTLLTAAIVILLFSFLYMISPLTTMTGFTSSFLDYIYFSCVTFSNLGSQDILPSNQIQRFLMFAESILGLFLVTMLIVIFTRKVIRE